MDWAKRFFELQISLFSKVVTFREFSLGWSEANIGDGSGKPCSKQLIVTSVFLEFSAKRYQQKKVIRSFPESKVREYIGTASIKVWWLQEIVIFHQLYRFISPQTPLMFPWKKNKGFIFLKHRMWLRNLFTCSILGYLCWAATPALQGMYETINLRAGCSPKRPTYIPSKSTVISQMLHRYLA